MVPSENELDNRPSAQEEVVRSVLDRLETTGAEDHKQAFPTDAAGAESRAVDVPVSAGDAVIFTEALVHGSAWHGPGRGAP